MISRAALFFLILFGATAPAAADQYYQIQGIGDLVVQVYGGGGPPFAPIKLNYAGIARNNLWRLTSHGYIVDPHGFCLVARQNAGDAPDVYLDGCVDKPFAKWRIERDHVFSETGRCLQAYGGAAAPGTPIHLNVCDVKTDTSPNNTWRLITPTDPADAGETTKEIALAATCNCVERLTDSGLVSSFTGWACGKRGCLQLCLKRIRYSKLSLYSCWGGSRVCREACRN